MLDGMLLIPLTKAKKHQNRRQERDLPQTTCFLGTIKTPKLELPHKSMHEKIPKTNTK